MNVVAQLDKGETKLLSLIAEHFLANEDFFHAIEVYQKMGDYQHLAQVHIKANQWDEVSGPCPEDTRSNFLCCRLSKLPAIFHN